MLTEHELDVLIEALKEWERKDDFGAFSEAMIGAMLYQKGTPEYDSMQEEMRNKKVEREKNRKIREETSVLIKAKLIQAKQDKTIDRLFSGE